MFVLWFLMFSPLWWLLIIGSVIGMGYSLERREKGVWAGAVLLTTILLITLAGDTPLLALIGALPWWGYLVLIGGYIVAGALWGIFRWGLYTNKKKAEYDTNKLEWLREHGVNAGRDVPDNLKKEYNDFLSSDNRYSYSITKKVKKPGATYYETVTERIIQIRPLAWRNWHRIGNWMGYWWASIIWWVFADAFQFAFRYVRHYLSGFLEAISIRQFKGVEADYAVPVEPENVYAAEPEYKNPLTK